ncbi:hypothetical protein N7530_004525 [Penicillium desertorum]|jgi:hypothetical protein|uniref:Polyketide synthase-like phosphopantetheine-binding domain-containing protein n=1 Tax=Penicillium desertorum TaxID=1303715 RepID=A0A9X0BQZ9_9EURO|nr:hypothetical protein N7530_004525 [Penicillium desertorum]
MAGIEDDQAAVEFHSEAAEIVAAGLADKVRSKFNLASDVAVTPDTQLSALGIDSLVAVDLRSWFVRSVDIPTLQILSGSPLWTLTADAVSKLPATLLPGILSRDESSKDVPSLANPSEVRLMQRDRRSVLVWTRYYATVPRR